MTHLDFLPKSVWDLEGKEYTALYLHSDHFHKNWLTSDFSHFVVAIADDPEMEDSGEYCFLVVPEAEDLDEIQL